MCSAKCLEQGWFKDPWTTLEQKTLLSSSRVFPCSFLLHGGIFDRRAFSAAFLAGSASSGSPSQDSPTLVRPAPPPWNAIGETRISSNPKNFKSSNSQSQVNSQVGWLCTQQIEIDSFSVGKISVMSFYMGFIINV